MNEADLQGFSLIQAFRKVPSKLLLGALAVWSHVLFFGKIFISMVF